MMVKLSRILVSVLSSALAALAVLIFLASDNCRDEGGKVRDGWMVCERASGELVSWVDIVGIRVVLIGVMVFTVALTFMLRLFSSTSEGGTNDASAS